MALPSLLLESHRGKYDVRVLKDICAFCLIVLRLDDTECVCGHSSIQGSSHQHAVSVINDNRPLFNDRCRPLFLHANWRLRLSRAVLVQIPRLRG